VHFTSSDAAANLPADYTFVASDNGTHDFSATFNTAGYQSLTATDTVTATLTGTAGGIYVNPAATDTLSVAGLPSPRTAGVAGTFTVTALNPGGGTDTSYRGTVYFTSSDAQAALPANYTFTAADNGVHRFSATLETAGTQSITASDTVTSTITGTQSGILVNPASFLVNGFTSPTTAGVSQTVTVTALNANGTTATAYTGTVHFTSSDAQAVLPADYSFTSTDAGVHSFTATLKTAGSQSLTATDTVTSTITGTQSGITVNAAAASRLTVTGFPSPSTAGVKGTFTVTARDPYGNTVSSYRGTVKFSSSDTKAVLPANYTFVAADNGVHTFTNGATLKSAGTRAITATDTVTSSLSGSQSGIVVNAAATSQFAVSGFPSPSTAGTAGTFTVTADDAYGNKTTGYKGTVKFTSSDAQAVLPTNYSFTSTDAGVHTFTNGATLKTAGSQTIVASDTVTSTITGKQTVSVNAAAAASLKVSGYPSPTTAGTSHTFKVVAEDAYGNTATSYTGTVTFSSSDAKAVLPANYTFVSGDHGVHTFSATFKTAGTQSITATDTKTGSITGTQSGITVNPAAASTLAVTGFPSPTTAGVSHSFTVTALDPYGNIATGYTGTVHFTSSDGKAGLPANYTFTTGSGKDNGVHTFSATLKTAGTPSITATDTKTGSITGTQSGITVNPAGATHLSISAPTSVKQGQAFTFTVTMLDAFGNVATGYTGTVHFTSSDGMALLPANYTFTSADAGVHTFTTTLNTAGSQSLTATDTVNSTITGTDSGIQVTMIPADRVFGEGPSAEDAGIPRQLLETGEVVEQLVAALAVVKPADSARAVADQGMEELQGAGYSQGAVGAAVAVLGFYWRDWTANPREPRRKRKGSRTPPT
jgi:hypothetical protein